MANPNAAVTPGGVGGGQQPGGMGVPVPPASASPFAISSNMVLGAYSYNHTGAPGGPAGAAAPQGNTAAAAAPGNVNVTQASGGDMSILGMAMGEP